MRDAGSDREIGRDHTSAWNKLAEQDSRQVPDFLLPQHEPNLGLAAINPARYTSAEFFAREVEKMWPNVWQFAAREEELLEPGAFVVYENAGRSYLLTRQMDGSVKAFHNVCLHRGRRLKSCSGLASEFRCPFHSFAWNIDGSLRNIPCRWDFPQLEGENMSLPEAQVGRWQGYIFVKENDGGELLEDFLAPLPTHFERWNHGECHTSLWAARPVAANWKACAEAFMEALHVVGTHPQVMPYLGDVTSKYMLWGDHVNLTITPMAVASPNIAHRGEQWVIEQFFKNNDRIAGSSPPPTVDNGRTARQVMGDFNRKRFGASAGRDLDFVSDAEALDAITYNVFPNFSPWGGFTPNLVYRFRPWPDENASLMEIRILTRLKPGEKMKPAVAMQLLAEDESWEAAFGKLGKVLDQDWSNLVEVQKGMRASKTGRLHLSNYQESRIRHFHQTLDKYLNA